MEEFRIEIINIIDAQTGLTRPLLQIFGEQEFPNFSICSCSKMIIFGRFLIPQKSTFFVTFLKNRLPALVGEHDFENCINGKSCQKELLRPSNRTDYAYFGAAYGTWNLQNGWEKCVFPAYGPSLEALVAIR